MMKYCSPIHCHVVYLMAIMCFCGFGFAHVPAMYMLGASLLDVGNNNYFPKLTKANYYPYGIDFPGGKATGRFSNGKNSGDCLVEMLGLVSPRPYFDLIFHTNNTAEFLKGVNFASGSAGILDSTNEGNCIPFSKQVHFFNDTVEAIAKQIGFEQTHEHFSKSFVVINVGSNDIFVTTGAGLNHEEYVALLIFTLRPLLKDIYHLGARKFVILSTGAEGCLPMFREKTKTGDCHSHANLLSKSYNIRLASLLEELQSSYDDFRYSFFDMRIAFKELYKSRKTYGFTEGEVGCCGTGKFNGSIQCSVGTVPCSNRSDHIFWDDVHYTEEAAKVFMNLAFEGSTPFVVTKSPRKRRRRRRRRRRWLQEWPLYNSQRAWPGDDGNEHGAGQEEDDGLFSRVKANHYPYGIDYIDGKSTGRFSNGKNAMDFLVEMLGVSSPQPSLSFNGTSDMVEEFLKGVNFASGGAGVLDTTYPYPYCIPFSQQVELFKEMVVATIEQIGIVQTYEHISNSFIVINIGNNDISFVADITVDPEEYVALLISTLQPRLKDMYIFGGRKFVTISAGAQGCMPVLRRKTETGECHERSNIIAKLYNKELASLMQVLQSQSSNGDLHYSFFDLYAGFEKLYDNRESLGFTEVLVACCGAGNFNGSFNCTSGTVPCSNRTDHIYWDNIHYTEAFTSFYMELAFQGSAPYVHPINVKQLGELPISYLKSVNVEQLKDL